MEQIKCAIRALSAKGWTLAAIADEVGVTSQTIENWNAGKRNASNPKGVLVILEALLRKKQIPKQRRYAKDSRQRKVTSNE